MCIRDSDGDEDIVVTNGHVMNHPIGGPAQESVVLANVGDGRFQRQLFAADNFLSEKHIGRGLVATDLDRDGDLDLVFALCNEPSAVLVNEMPRAGSSVVVHLTGTASNRDAIGARAVLHTSHGDYLRTVVGGGSYLSQAEFDLFWGIPHGTTITSLTVHWPNGASQEIEVGDLKDIRVLQPAM